MKVAQQFIAGLVFFKKAVPPGTIENGGFLVPN
jgi:hypothetical protein